jgi:hypothetical protein
MEESKMKKHVTVVGAIQIGFSVLGLIGAVGTFFLFNFLKTIVGSEGEGIPETLFTALQIGIPLLLGFISTLGLVGAIGMLSYKNWGRILIIVVAGLGLISIPIGTLKGVYFIWVLLQDDTIKLFKSQGQSL